MTLRDALEALLADRAGRVAVTGQDGAYVGTIDIDTVTARSPGERQEHCDG